MQYVEWQENRVSPNFECRQSNENMRLSHWCENRISILINDNILRCVRRKNLLFSLPDTKKYPRCRRVNGNSECWTEIQASCASRLVRHVRFVISFLPLFPRNNKFRISNGKWFTRRVRRRGLVARRVIYMLCFFFHFLLHYLLSPFLSFIEQYVEQQQRLQWSPWIVCRLRLHASIWIYEHCHCGPACVIHPR